MAYCWWSVMAIGESEGGAELFLGCSWQYCGPFRRERVEKGACEEKGIAELIEVAEGPRAASLCRLRRMSLQGKQNDR
jgi:hypothetical protein